MKYYILKHNRDKKDIGCVFPQVQELPIKSQDLKGIEAGDRSRFVVKVAENAILTDVISSYFLENGLIINSKVKKILEKYKIMEMAFYPIYLCKDESLVEDYFICRYETQVKDQIVFSKSELKVRERYPGLGFLPIKHDPIYATSMEEVIKISKKFREKKLRVEFKKVKLKHHFDIDIFKIPYDIHLYLSKKLVHELLDNQVTGIEFYEFDDLQIDLASE